MRSQRHPQHIDQAIFFSNDASPLYLSANRMDRSSSTRGFFFFCLQGPIRPDLLSGLGVSSLSRNKKRNFQGLTVIENGAMRIPHIKYENAVEIELNPAEITITLPAEKVGG